MSTAPGNPMRLPSLNLEWGQNFYQSCRREIESFEPTGQSCWESHAHALVRAGRLAYALGYPVCETRGYFRQSVDAYREVFRRRGQSIATRVSYNDGQPLPEEIIVDDGYTSVDSFDAAILALIVSDVETARELVELAGHSPCAEYVSPRSEICTSNEQTLSHALNALLSADFELAQLETRKLELRRGTRHDKQLGAIMSAIATDSDALSGIEELLDAHQKKAKRHENLAQIQYMLCLPALGLAQLAISFKRMELADLDPANLYAPTALIQDKGGSDL